MAVQGFDLEWREAVTVLARLATAYVLALPIAWNREARSHGAGLRTFPIVAIASCGFMLTGTQALESKEAMARVMYGVITGIGFIGGGAILKSSREVHGTATAASLWNTGAVGVAVALGQHEIAVALSLMNFLTLLVLSRWKKEGGPEGDSLNEAGTRPPTGQPRSD
jgi:putative Mg2+ transporter-C (MgtC) family protein